MGQKQASFREDLISSYLDFSVDNGLREKRREKKKGKK